MHIVIIMALVEAISMHLCSVVLPTVVAVWTMLSRSVMALGRTDDKKHPLSSSNATGTESIAAFHFCNSSWQTHKVEMGFTGTHTAQDNGCH